MIWLALHFPHLALEGFTRAQPNRIAAAIHETRKGRQVIVDCNRLAQQAGVRRDHSVATALAMCADLQTWAYDAAREQKQLQALADFCYRYSSQLSLELPATLFIEVAGSERLFHSLPALRNTIHHEIHELGYSVTSAMAPTPLAALWLAMTGNPVILEQRRFVVPVLGKLSVQQLPVAESHKQKLARLGIRTLAECFVLPRDGMLRRFGKSWLEQLDRLRGLAPDPRKMYRPAARFCSELELPAETVDVQALLFGLRRLLLELQGVLTAHDAMVQQLVLILVSEDAPKQSVELSSLRMVRQADQWLALFRERLERVNLAAPVRELILQADSFLQQGAMTTDMFAESSSVDAWPRFVDRLVARLGADVMHRLHCVADHRPEHACASQATRRLDNTAVSAARPLWLLLSPLPLTTHDGVPQFHGRLLLSAAERIESGWWDGNDVARDYHVGCNHDGECYWLYRDLRSDNQWYLHGIFG
ncbi:MAG: DNA polymerase Y family protein [Gammaproteobacteria bacterium]|nr:DNA polymerase Y family protein [Gammaproteobacteria bacterium]